MTEVGTGGLEKEFPRKVTARHLERWALVYVRQSTPQQLVRHQESTRVQYALRERAKSLGWEAERIEVIDDDLGRSGATMEGRPGFQRLVAEVGLDHVGMILGVEMSRFARSCRDWHQLLETCGVFGTLIADLDGVYDPSEYNDRLLLGLKGTMSEAELHILKRRMLEGKLAKARRGELGKAVPMGYVRRPSGEITKDPDEHAQAVIETVFQQFQVRRTIQGALRYLIEQGLKLPVREQGGPQKGELSWHSPSRICVRQILKNPIYAGAYVLGLRPTDRRKQKPGRRGTGRSTPSVGEWEVFLPNRLPAYISWEQYLMNQEQMKANVPQGSGVPRNGSALLAGLLFCGRCGRRMRTVYAGPRLAYQCAQDQARWHGRLCQSLSGRGVDEAVERQVLEVLRPAGLEVSLAVAANVEAERAKDEALWRQRLERAQFQANRAKRQYDAVEPENRLVARNLEREWEEKLRELRDLEEAHRRHRAQAPMVLTEAERDAIRVLAQDVPALWSQPTTTHVDRKEIIRTLIDRIALLVLGDSERVQMTIHWAGGHETTTELSRPVQRLDQLSYLARLLDRVQDLHKAGRTSREIAEVLNAEGWQPAKQAKGGTTFTPVMVGTLLARRGLSDPGRGWDTRPGALGPDEWTLVALAKVIPMPPPTLYSWAHRKWVKGRQTDGLHPRWILWADADEIRRLRELHAQPSAHNPIPQPPPDDQRT